MLLLFSSERNSRSCDVGGDPPIPPPQIRAWEVCLLRSVKINKNNIIIIIIIIIISSSSSSSSSSSF